MLALALGIANAQAQIPAEVTEVMGKCRAAMTNATGLEYEMDMKAGIGPLAMKMHFVVANKGNLNRTLMRMMVLGTEIVTENGFDGTDSWEIDHAAKETQSDTITFTHGNKQKKSKNELSYDLDKQYNKAKMKLKDGYYEITFSEPKDKTNEVKSATVKISEKNYVIREMRTGARGAKVSMKITKIRVGLKDSYFKLDTNKYPGAVIIRK